MEIIVTLTLGVLLSFNTPQSIVLCVSPDDILNNIQNPKKHLDLFPFD